MRDHFADGTNFYAQKLVSLKAGIVIKTGQLQKARGGLSYASMAKK
jgi:hypothetical protein